MNATNTTKTPAAIEATVTGQSLLLTFANGKRLEMSANMFSGTVQAQAMMHGFKQKLVDAAAMSRNPETGRSATIDDKYNAVREVFERLQAGQWNKVREGGGNAGGLLFRALCQMYDRKTPEDIKAWLDAKTDEEKAALRATPKVAAIIATLKTEKASSVDTDAMLGELGA